MNHGVSTRKNRDIDNLSFRIPVLRPFHANDLISCAGKNGKQNRPNESTRARYDDLQVGIPLFFFGGQSSVHLVVLTGIVQIRLSHRGMAVYALPAFLLGVFGSSIRERDNKQSHRTGYSQSSENFPQTGSPSKFWC